MTDDEQNYPTTIKQLRSINNRIFFYIRGKHSPSSDALATLIDAMVKFAKRKENVIAFDKYDFEAIEAKLFKVLCNDAYIETDCERDPKWTQYKCAK